MKNNNISENNEVTFQSAKERRMECEKCRDYAYYRHGESQWKRAYTQVKGILNNFVGKPWVMALAEIHNKVVPPIGKNLNQVLDNLIIYKTWVENGEVIGHIPYCGPLQLKDGRISHRFFVDPKNGLVTRNIVIKKTEKSKILHLNNYHNINGLWYEITFSDYLHDLIAEKMAEPPEKLPVGWKAQSVDAMISRLAYKYQDDPLKWWIYIVPNARQVGGKELRDLRKRIAEME